MLLALTALPAETLELPPWSVLPFALTLAGIAILPLAAPHWWESNRNKALFSAALGLPAAVWLLIAGGAEGAHHLSESLAEYVSFISLLAALYVITGCVHLRGSLSGTPLANTGLLALGGLLASFIGTTGASMLLIRPLLSANAHRPRRAHIVVFFIFIVSNCGGLLTPLGDPPLYLGFLSGVPFAWTFSLWKPWLFVNLVLLALFNLLDQRMLVRDERDTPGSLLDRVVEHVPLRIDGAHNALFLGGIMLTILASGQGWLTGGARWPFGLQEGLFGALACAAWYTTRPSVRAANAYSAGPIVEVAVLFVGIFVTMTPPLLLLNAHGPALGLDRPWQYFWATGAFSSVLDNAPTYLTFSSIMAGQYGVSVTTPGFLAEVLDKGAQAGALLAAVSCGAVMMGANTYIGNGPNFMVKAVAESAGVKMPGFGGYLLWSGAVLLPLFGVVTWLFFA